VDRRALTAAAGLATAGRADVVLAEDLAEAATSADAHAKRIVERPRLMPGRCW
jgi:hypothetical protein